MPPTLSDMVMRLLEKEPERRYQGADGLRHDLLRLSDMIAHREDILFVFAGVRRPLL
jgi:serine/threonine protein kinase